MKSLSLVKQLSNSFHSRRRSLSTSRSTLSFAEAVRVLNLPTTPHSQSPTKAEIKKAFYSQALLLHPDLKNSNRTSADTHTDEDKKHKINDSVEFTKLVEAFELLTSDNPPTPFSSSSSPSSSYDYNNSDIPKRPRAEIENNVEFLKMFMKENFIDEIAADVIRARNFRVGDLLSRNKKKVKTVFDDDDEECVGWSEDLRSSNAVNGSRSSSNDVMTGTGYWDLNEDLTNGLDRAYYGPRLPWDNARDGEGDGQDEAVLDTLDWPWSIELDQRSSETKSEADAAVEHDPTSTEVARYSDLGGEGDPKNIVELVFGRNFLGHVRRMEAIATDDDDDDDDDEIHLQLTYRADHITTAKRTTSANPDGTRFYVYTFYAADDTIICKINDDAHVPSKVAPQNFLQRFLTKITPGGMRRVCRVIAVDSEVVEYETHVMIFTRSPGVEFCHILRNGVNQRKLLSAPPSPSPSSDASASASASAPDSDINPSIFAVFMSGQNSGLVETKLTRATLLPSSLWYYAPRSATHDVGGWLIERLNKRSGGRGGGRGGIGIDFKRRADSFFDFKGDEGKVEVVLRPEVITLFLGFLTLEKEEESS